MNKKVLRKSPAEKPIHRQKAERSDDVGSRVFSDAFRRATAKQSLPVRVMVIATGDKVSRAQKKAEKKIRRLSLDPKFNHFFYRDVMSFVQEDEDKETDEGQCVSRGVGSSAHFFAILATIRRWCLHDVKCSVQIWMKTEREYQFLVAFPAKLGWLHACVGKNVYQECQATVFGISDPIQRARFRICSFDIPSTA